LPPCSPRSRKLTPRLDILVNNAGISGIEGRTGLGDIVALRLKQADEAARGGPVETFLDVTVSTNDASWRRMLGVHVDGTFYCCREALKIMNPQMAGSIINMGSIMGTYGKPAGSTSYSTAKAAIMGFTRALAHEVTPRNIRVNAIAPGYIDTDMTAPSASSASASPRTRRCSASAIPTTSPGPPSTLPARRPSS
jgi:3-oxoacyl-[acyl-carrier protein] reductase